MMMDAGLSMTVMRVRDGMLCVRRTAAATFSVKMSVGH
jgi:hypothetical protein